MQITRLFDFIQHQLENYPREDAFVMKVNGNWQKTSTQNFIHQVNKVSRGLIKMGIKPSDKIALISTTNRTEWYIMDLALQQIGAINVPVYPTISSKDYEYIFNNSEVKFCFVSDSELYEKVKVAKPNISSLVAVYTFDEVEGAPNWLEVMDLGEDDSTQHEVEHLKSLVKPEDLVTIIYTSGTTGQPKGVMLTHNNIVSNVIASAPRVPKFRGNAKALSFLPICHIFERMLTYLYQYAGIGIYFAESIESIGDNLKEVKPNVMTVVPRLIEKVYNKIYDKGTGSGGLKANIFLWAVGLVEDYSPYEKKSFIWNLKYKLASSIVFKKWREGVGGNLECMVSGSAALSSRLNHIFWGAGIPILEGYGATETSPVISVNQMSKDGFMVGSVGKPLENLDVKLIDDHGKISVNGPGEIVVKGPSVTQGYFKNEEKTKEAFTEDGYYKTGDVGVFENGLLKITDRKKEMFKTSGGKYIAPQMLENELKQSRFIEQIMVVGEGEKMPCALIQPDFEVLKEWVNRKEISCGSDNESLIKNEKVLKRIQKELEKRNQQFGKWEQIKKFKLTPDIWSIDDGHLTPTLKLKRKVVKEKYKDLYNDLYS